MNDQAVVIEEDAAQFPVDHPGMVAMLVGAGCIGKGSIDQPGYAVLDSLDQHFLVEQRGR